MKIALIAMSGVRTYNPELLELGMTLPGFVERGRAVASLPSLSLLTLAALTPAHHELSYHEVEDIQELDELPVCDLAAISSLSAQINEAYALAHRYRAEGVRTAMGGLHVTACPEEALRHCDIVVVGEGEISWPRLLHDIEAGRAQKIYESTGGEFDLAAAPVPRFDLLEPDRYNRLTLQTSRGCPWRCEFCASSILLTSHYKLKPVDNVIAEIRAIKRIWSRPFIEFADDNSFVDKRRSRLLLEALAKEEVRWFTETDVSVADDPDLLALMGEAGCAEILIGFESPSATGLDGIELRQNWKRGRLSAYRDAVERVQSNGIRVNACFVLGLDGDGPEVFDAVEEFVEETQPFDVQIAVQTAFPGSPLYERLRAEGRLIDKEGWNRCTLFDVNFRPLRMAVEDLEHGLVELGRRLYSEEATERRKRGFKDQWRGARRASPVVCSGADRRSEGR